MSSSSRRTFFQSVQGLFKRYPMIRECGFGCVTWAVGDIICQVLMQESNIRHELKQQQQQQQKNDDDDDAYTTFDEKSSTSSIWARFDYARTGRMAFYGTFIASPIYVHWYHNLDKFVVPMMNNLSASSAAGNNYSAAANAALYHGGNMEKAARFNGKIYESKVSRIFRRMFSTLGLGTLNFRIIALKIIFDIAVFDPAYLSLFFFGSTAMEKIQKNVISTKESFNSNSNTNSKSNSNSNTNSNTSTSTSTSTSSTSNSNLLMEIGSDGWKKVKDEFGYAYVMDVSVWTFFQAINFTYVPVPYQAMFVQSLNVFWNGFLSYVGNR